MTAASCQPPGDINSAFCLFVVVQYRPSFVCPPHSQCRETLWYEQCSNSNKAQVTQGGWCLFWVAGGWWLPAAGADQLPEWCICTKVELEICTKEGFQAKRPCCLLVKSLRLGHSFLPATWCDINLLFFSVVWLQGTPVFVCPPGTASAEQHCVLNSAAARYR